MRRARTLLRTLSTVLLLVPCAALQAVAREVCDPADAAFNGSVAVDLTSVGRPLNDLTGAPLAPGDLTYQFTSNGVTFLFESLDGTVLDGSLFGVDGLLSSIFGGGAGSGVALTVSPAVPAIGLLGYELDGCPGATYVGTGGSQVSSPLSCNPGIPCTATQLNPGFFGAADIGSVAAVSVTYPGSIFVVTGLRFVSVAAPVDDADLSVAKQESNGVRFVLNGDPVSWDIDVDNAGPDAASDTLVSDFLPRGIFSDAVHSGVGADGYDPASEVYSLVEPSVASQGSVFVRVDATAPADRGDFTCKERLTNVAIVGSAASDPDPTNNLAIDSVAFDDAAVANVPEDCNDGIDNDCNGRIDCSDSPCTCRPSLQPLPGGTAANPLCAGILGTGLVHDERGNLRYCGPAVDHGCTVPRGTCGGVTVPAACCDVSLWSNPQAVLNLSACDVGVPGCVPRDPNWKDSIPGVTIEGYGYTQAGQTITYILHYENEGNADAHDVQVIDVLDPDLDDATLVIHDGGVYDPATRALVWGDPLVPPATPRQVSFEIDVRGNAPPGTRVHNVGTILFPDAVPPTRIDTNFVEHVVPDPGLVIAAELSVLGCTETAPGSGLWTVDLGNEGHGFAYDVTATILNPPPSVVVTDPLASFAHPDDPSDGSFTTVVPAAITTSADTVAFVTETPGEPCAALVWRVVWEDMAGGVFSDDVQEEPDADADAVADAADNCPGDYNPDQADGDGDGAGDACDAPPAAALCDVDADGDIDKDDVNVIFAARGQAASGPDDPRDANADGVISVNDSRLCVLQCTLPNCVSPAPSCGMLGVEPLLLLALARRRWRRILAAGPGRQGEPR